MNIIKTEPKIRHTEKKPPLVEPWPPTTVKTDWRVGWLKKAWAWLDYKKTIIGGVLTVAGLLIPGPWGIALQGIGLPLASAGVIHKGIKGLSEMGKADGKEWWEKLIEAIIEVLKQFLKLKKGG